MTNLNIRQIIGLVVIFLIAGVQAIHSVMPQNISDSIIAILGAVEGIISGTPAVIGFFGYVKKNENPN